jgi:phosphopantothenoylcysteine decarboxylase/phosphopantothenate--cysteine ligase
MRAILITAGATRNPIDAMRFISAHSTGRTGAWLATALSQVAHVTMLGSPLALTHCAPPVVTLDFTSTQDLMNKMEVWVRANPDGLVIHAAAVGDYAVADLSADQKIPSGQEVLSLRLIPTPKILDAIRDWSGTVSLVSFKAASPGTTGSALEAIAANQGKRTGSDRVFANTIGALDSDVLIWSASGCTWHQKREDALEALLCWARDQVTG